MFKKIDFLHEKFEGVFGGAIPTKIVDKIRLALSSDPGDCECRTWATGTGPWVSTYGEVWGRLLLTMHWNGFVPVHNPTCDVVAKRGKCSECNARAWFSQKIGEPCRWEYDGEACQGTIIGR